MNRVYIQRERFLGPDERVHSRWAVRWCENGDLYAYGFTWFGAWRLACHAVGWKVPT